MSPGISCGKSYYTKIYKGVCMYRQNYNNVAPTNMAYQQQQGTRIGLNAVPEILNMLTPQQIQQVCGVMGIQDPRAIQATLMTAQPGDQTYVLGLLGNMYDTNMQAQHQQQQQMMPRPQQMAPMGRPAMASTPMMRSNMQNMNPNNLFKPNTPANMCRGGTPVSINRAGTKATGVPHINNAPAPAPVYNGAQHPSESPEPKKLQAYRGSEFEPLVISGNSVARMEDGKYYEYRIQRTEGDNMNKLDKDKVLVINGDTTETNNIGLPVKGDTTGDNDVIVGIISNDHFGYNTSLNNTFLGNYLRLVSRDKNVDIVAIDALTLNATITSKDFNIDGWYEILSQSSTMLEVGTKLVAYAAGNQDTKTYAKHLDKMITRKINERFKHDIHAGLQLESFITDHVDLYTRLSGVLEGSNKGINIAAVLNKVLINLKFDMEVAKWSKDEIEAELNVLEHYKEIAVPEYVTTIYVNDAYIIQSLEAAYNAVKGVKTFQLTEASHPVFYDMLEYLKTRSRFDHELSAAIITDEGDYRVFYSEYGYYTITKFH